jgi:hypothetical protein
MYTPCSMITCDTLHCVYSINYSFLSYCVICNREDWIVLYKWTLFPVCANVISLRIFAVIRFRNTFLLYTLEKTEGAIRNGQSRETGNNGYTRHGTNNKESQYVFDTIMRKQTQITWIRPQLSYKHLEVKTYRTSFLYGNRIGHYNTGLRTKRHIIGQHKRLKRREHGHRQKTPL